MVRSASQASSNYERGIRRIGISAYEEAARADTPQEAAEALEDAKAASLSVGDMVDAYQDAYS